ncbi:MAG: response regulator [Elusimicrobia bacterium]|nr:response regulator [Elusimicrobiota bacterium]
MAKILVVDDEDPIVALLTFILEKSGHAVSAAKNGQEALRALGVDPVDEAAALPDVVILDVMMPIMDGYTAAIAIKNCPRTASLPILVVTAKDDMRLPFESVPSVAGFFEKPFDPRQLREAVLRVTAAKAPPGT